MWFKVLRGERGAENLVPFVEIGWSQEDGKGSGGGGICHCERYWDCNRWVKIGRTWQDDGKTENRKGGLG